MSKCIIDVQTCLIRCSGRTVLAESILEKNINRTFYFVYTLNNIYKQYLTMHWSMIVCLMYLWKSRGTYVDSSHTPKPCVKCRFFMPPTDDIYRPSNVKLGKCLLYPYSDRSVATLVVGMSEPDYGGNYQYAIIARMSDTMCGELGTQFSAKPAPRRRSPMSGFHTKY